MYEEPLTLTDDGLDAPPSRLASHSFASLYKTQQNIGHIATRTMRHARRIFVSEQPALGSTMSSTALVGEVLYSSLPSRKTLKKDIERTNEPLAYMKTVFPFKLFTDEITLDRTKITVTRRNFFFCSDTMSIRIEDILNVSVGVDIFFGALTIATRVLSSDDHFMLTRFWRKDAIHMKHMIQGFVIARHNNIEIDHLDHDELVKTLTELGHDTHRDPAT